MKDIAAFIARTLAILLAALFVVLAAAALFTFNAQRLLLKPDLYKSALARQDLYGQFPSLAAKQIVRSLTYQPCVQNPDDPACQAEGQGEAGAEQGGPPSYFKELEEEDWEVILGELLPAAWLQEQTESALDQLFAGLESGEPEAPVLVSTREIRERLLGEPGARALTRLFETLPPCTTVDLAAMTAAQWTLESLPLCRTPDNIWTGYQLRVRLAVREEAAKIPDRTDLTGGAASGSEGQAQEGRQGSWLTEVRRALGLAPLVALGLLAGVTVFGVRSLRGLLQWWGVPVLLAGLLGAALALLADVVLGYAFLVATSRPSASFLAPEVTQTAFEIVAEVVRSVSGRTLTQAVLLALSGLAMIAGSFVVRRPAESRRKRSLARRHAPA